MKKLFLIITAALGASCGMVKAQSVTYYHDASKQAQVTVMEIGAGALTPELYYTVTHNSYKKGAAGTNKNMYRLAANAASIPQVEMADSIQSYLEARAKEEALNIADRELDVAWMTEGSKIESRLLTFKNNINGLIGKTNNQEITSWQEHMQADSQQTQSSQDGWNNLIGSIGLEGVGDTMNHLGFTLANLPDMLLGIFTGKTKSIGMNQSTMMPLAAIIAGTFIKNPLLKFPMMLWGGANLVNKMGQEALAEHRGTANSQGAEAKTTYKQYPHELLDKRITNPVIEGDKLILNIDNVPRIVTLTPVMLDAYNQGALPLNVIANRVLSKSDAQQTQNVEQTQHASQRYEQSQVQEQSRGIR